MTTSGAVTSMTSGAFPRRGRGDGSAICRFASAAAQCREDDNLRPVTYGCFEPSGVAYVLSVDEDIDVWTELAELCDDAIAHPRTFCPEQRERFRYGMPGGVSADVA